MEKPSEVGRRDETGRMKGKPALVGGQERWAMQRQGKVAGRGGKSINESKQWEGRKPKFESRCRRAAVLEWGQRSESAKWAMRAATWAALWAADGSSGDVGVIVGCYETSKQTKSSGYSHQART